MKNTILFFILMAISLATSAQTYVGTMTVDSYTRENVKVTLKKSEKEGIVLTMYKV